MKKKKKGIFFMKDSTTDIKQNIQENSGESPVQLSLLFLESSPLEEPQPNLKFSIDQSLQHTPLRVPCLAPCHGTSHQPQDNVHSSMFVRGQLEGSCRKRFKQKNTVTGSQQRNYFTVNGTLTTTDMKQNIQLMSGGPSFNSHFIYRILFTGGP